ncbi:MAG: zinc-ribbon domain-containing protein [Terriglobales bacterium]
MICPNCREDNAPNFRFCGMCGASLEARRPPGAPTLDPLAAFPPKISPNPKIGNAPESRRPLAVENATTHSSQTVPPIGGPSVLGLNQPATNQSSLNQPGLESLRENAFSGLDSFFEPEQPKSGAGRIVLMIVLLAALGGAGWWTYTNYLGAAGGQKLRAAISNASESAAAKLSPKPAAKDTTPAPDASSSPASSPETGTADGASGKAAESVTPDAAPKTADTGAKPARETKPATPAKTVLAEKSAAKRERRAALAKASKLTAAAAPGSGDAEFQKGAAYLYGRGVRENCDEAVKNLKAASAQSNAKARSAFGTMYATGHCVPRDLPTSYSWFALALRVDPNNQILEKDLNAVWNQMTPPERQMATRMKQ